MDNGVVVTAALAADLERRLAVSESTDEKKQCENPIVAYLILTNHPPTDEQADECGRERWLQCILYGVCSLSPVTPAQVELGQWLG